VIRSLPFVDRFIRQYVQASPRKTIRQGSVL
jgi:hypothetical protein